MTTPIEPKARAGAPDGGGSATAAPQATPTEAGPRPTRSLTRLRTQLALKLGAPLTLLPNERVLCTEVIFQAITDAGAMSFLAVFLVRLGAPTWLVGLFSSLPALVTILSALPMGSFVQQQPSLVRTVNWGRLIYRSILGLFAFLPLLPPTIAPYILVGARSAMAVPMSAVDVSFTTILGRAVSPQRRPTLLSTRLAIHGLVAAVAGFVAGQWLDYAPYPTNYQVLFVSAFVAGVGSIWVMSRLKLPEQEVAPAALRRFNLSAMVTLLRDTPAFRRYSTASLLYRLSMSMPSALYAVYRVRTLGASDAWIGTVLTVERVVSVFAYFALGRFLARPERRRWLWVSTLGVSLYPLLTAAAVTPELLVLPAIAGGIFGSGSNVFLTNTLLQVSTEEERPTFAAANTFLANLCAFIGPLLGTILADAIDIVPALVIIGALRLLGGLSFWRLGVGRER